MNTAEAIIQTIVDSPSFDGPTEVALVKQVRGLGAEVARLRAALLKIRQTADYGDLSEISHIARAALAGEEGEGK